MNILVLYTNFSLKDRKTIGDSLFSFKRYVQGDTFFYLDVRQPCDIPPELSGYPFDGVILHYTLLANRFAYDAWPPLADALGALLERLDAYKVMVPHDEYLCADDVCALAKRGGIGHIFTCAAPRDYALLYPAEKTGGAGCSTVFAGYVDERTLQLVRRFSRRNAAHPRPYDIGYRARRLPYWIGIHGQLKAEVADRFNERLRHWPALVTDIKNTGPQEQNTFQGDSWIEFLLRCRTMLGCLGGSGLLDRDGSIARAVDAYCEANPGAGFAEVEAACFPGRDGGLHLYILSPRHFECAMTKTCQVLVEGDYFGVLQPGVHYIEIKKDFSNIDEVLEQIQDHALCERIAQRCYDDVVAKPGAENPCTYAWYANHVVDYIRAHQQQPGRTIPAGEWKRLGRKLNAANRRRVAAMAREIRRVRFYSFFDRHPGLTRLLSRVKRLLTGRRAPKA